MMMMITIYFLLENKKEKKTELISVVSCHSHTTLLTVSRAKFLEITALLRLGVGVTAKNLFESTPFWVHAVDLGLGLRRVYEQLNAS